MPHYYFNIRYGRGPDKLAVDPEGNDLADVEAARQYALQSAQDLIAGPRLLIVRDWFACAFEVEDENACRVLTVPFSDIVPEEEDED